MADKNWKVIYWPGFPGRGDFVRLMFEEAGVPYEEVSKTGGTEAVFKYYQGKHTGYPVFAPPIITNDDGFVLCSTPAILFYLGKIFNMYPGNPEDEARAMQINCVVADYLGEGHDAFHPKDKNGTYDSQKEEAKIAVEKFCAKRLPKYLGNLEACLVENNGGEGFFIGSNITFVDIAVFHALRATEAQFPEYYADCPFPKLRSFKTRIASRPNIAAFLKSDRSLPFCGNSMM